MNAYIGRQPIFDRYNRIAGYELLYRSDRSQDSAKIQDGDAATREVLSDAITVFGIPQLTNHLPAYINFTENLLLADFVLKADPEEVVVMVPEDINVNEQTTEKLRALRKAGYRLALHGYEGQPKFRRVTNLFQILCVDFSRVNSIRRKEIAWNFSGPGVELLAVKVETFSDFAAAKNMGYSLFQGYYFERPVCLSKELPPLADSTYGRILLELMKPAPNLRVCRAMITEDIVFSYLLLRNVQNSSSYRGKTVMDLPHALMVVGEPELWRLTCVVMLLQNNVSPSDEFARGAYLRGLFMESIAKRCALRMNAQNGFVVGMFSLLDRVMDTPLEEVLDGFAFPEDMHNALLERERLFNGDCGGNPYALLLKYAMIYELANERIELPDIQLRMSDNEVYNLYMSCMEETDKMFAQMGSG